MKQIAHNVKTGKMSVSCEAAGRHRLPGICQRSLRIFLATLAVFLGFGATLLHAVQNSLRPNIVLILADDLGYGSLNCYGAPASLVRTPNCDRLAKEGVRFTDANTPSSVCSPTRYALLTGRYCWRTEMKWGVCSPYDHLWIEPGRLTVASLLKKAGYNTAVIGKWHLGFGSAPKVDYTKKLSPGPLDIGFNYYFGIPAVHGDHMGVYIDNEGVQGLRSDKLTPYGKTFYGGPYIGLDAPQRDEEHVMSVLTDKAIDWLNRQDAAKPFFLYFAPVAVHHPCTPSAQTRTTSGCGDYGDWIHEFDLSVGRILDALDKDRQTQDTLVILTSDNGGVLSMKSRSPQSQMTIIQAAGTIDVGAGSVPEATAYAAGLRPNGTWRGGKHSIYEGGFRVPYIARWPGKIKPGRVCDETISLADTLATVAAIARETLPPPDQAAEDSFDILPALLDRPHERPLRPHLITHSAAGVYAIRQGSWKWIEGKPVRPSEAQKTGSSEYREQLYRLDQDSGETNNQIEQHSDVAGKLKLMLEQCRNATFTRPKS